MFPWLMIRQKQIASCYIGEHSDWCHLDGRNGKNTLAWAVNNHLETESHVVNGRSVVLVK